MTTQITTDALIAQIAAAPAPKPLQQTQMLARGLLVLGALLAVLLSVIGLRPDLGSALFAPVTGMKTWLPLGVGLTAMVYMLRYSHPEEERSITLLWLALLCAAALWVFTLVQTPSSRIIPDLMGHTSLFCLASVFTLSIVPSLIWIEALKRSAPTRPRLTGAMVGVCVGGLTTAGYSMFCREDVPLFFVTWYGLAILACGAFGAVIGAYRLRW